MLHSLQPVGGFMRAAAMIDAGPQYNGSWDKGRQWQSLQAASR